MKKKDHKCENVYIVLSHTGTVLSNLIKTFTNAEFSHVSISLDKDLEEMYSFGRLNPYNPFYAGFVHEEIHSGTFKRFRNTKAEIYSLPVTKNQYIKIQKVLENMKSEKETYSFNIVGLFANGLNIKYRQRHSFYCAEFVKYLLDRAEVDLELPDLVKPKDFVLPDRMNLEYRGLLRKYKKETFN